MQAFFLLALLVQQASANFINSEVSQVGCLHAALVAGAEASIGARCACVCVARCWRQDAWWRCGGGGHGVYGHIAVCVCVCEVGASRWQ